ncbi:hypothetical protein TNCV_3777191 [Trichonephila clavipes]|nr:hypothetical protein TNCV_3777191 [Trichonephila clavipes]
MTHPDIPIFYGYSAPSRRGNVSPFARVRPQRWGKKDAFHQIPFLVNSKNRANVKIAVVTNFGDRRPPINNKFNGIWSASALGHVQEISGVNKEAAAASGIGNGTTFVMARFKIPVDVFTLTTLTRPSLPGNISRIRPIDQSKGLVFGSFIKTS